MLQQQITGAEPTDDGFRIEITTKGWGGFAECTFDVEAKHFDRNRYVHVVGAKREGKTIEWELPYWYVADATGTQVG